MRAAVIIIDAWVVVVVAVFSYFYREKGNKLL